LINVRKSPQIISALSAINGSRDDASISNVIYETIQFFAGKCHNPALAARSNI